MRNRRSSVERGEFEVPNRDSSVSKNQYEITFENTDANEQDDNPFAVADDCDDAIEEIRKNPYAEKIDKESSHHSRNSSPSPKRRGRYSMPNHAKPQLTLTKALDEYLQKCKAPENFLQLRT